MKDENKTKEQLIEELVQARKRIAQIELGREYDRTQQVSIADFSSNGIYVYDFDLQRNIYINQAYSRLLGHTLEEFNDLKPEEFMTLFHPDDHERILAHMNDVIESIDNEVYEIEYRFRSVTGNWEWCLSRDTVFARSDEGNVSQMIGSFVVITKHKEIQEKLSLSEARWRSLVENAPNILFEFNREGIIQFINHTTDDLEVDDVIGSSLFDFTPPHDHPRVRGFIEQVHQTGEALSYEAQGLDGEWYSVRIGAIKHGENIDSLMMILTNITKLKESEIVLRETQGRLLQAMLVAGVGIWDWEIATDLTQWYGRMFDIYGVSPEEFTGKGSDYIDFTREDYKQQQLENIQNAFGAGITEEQLLSGSAIEYNPKELCIVRADGTEVYTLGDAIAIVDENGEAIRMTGVTIDVTERKIAEEKLLLSEARLRSFVNALPDPVFILDRDGLTVEVLTSHEELLYREAEHQKGQKIDELFSPEQAKRFMSAIQQALDTRQVQSLEYEMEVLAGKRWFESRVAPMPFVDGDDELVVLVARDITERKQIEDVLLESEAKYRLVVENQNDLIAKYDLEGVLQFVSPSYCATFGKTEEELLGRSFLPLIHEDDRDRVAQLLENLHDPPHTFYNEEQALTQDGWRWFAWSNRLVLNTNGQVDFVIAVGRDITERKEFENALHFQAQLLGAVGQAIIATDLEGEITFWNHKAETLYGWSATEVLGQNIIEITPAPSNTEHSTEIMALLKSGKSWSGELMLQRRDGSLFPAWVVDAPVHDNDGNLIGIIGVSSDITGRKQFENALRESETRFRTIFENSKDAIGVSRAGIHVTANPAYIEMFGYETLDELIGKPILDRIAPGEHTRITTYIRQRLQGESTPTIYETRGRKQDGTEFEMETRVSTYTLDDEVFTIAILRDISVQKQIEQTLYFIAQKGWMVNNQRFIESVVQFLGEQLNVAYAFVGKLSEAHDSVETIAEYANGEIGDNFTYALNATPCENVIGKELCCYSQNVQQLFPQDHLLQEMRIEGYMGLPLWDSRGKPSGIIVVQDTKPLREIEKLKTILQIVATSVSHEMEREQTETALRQSAAQYQSIASTTLDGFLIIDREGHFLDVNDRYCQMIGYSRDELLKMSLANIEVQETSEEIGLHIAKIIDKGFDRFQSQHRHKDGSVIDIEVSTTFMSETERFLAFFRDITRQKLSERMLQARLGLSEFAINHSICELLQKTLDEAEQLTDSNIGFFHFLGIDQETLTLQAWSTNTLTNMCTAEAKDHHYPVSEAGVWVDCIHQRKPVIHNDYASLSHRQGMPDGHAPVVRELVVPIMRDDLIVAIIGVGNKRTDYNNSDVEIVHQLANMVWDIIARKQTEIELQRSEELIALKNRFVSTVSHEFKTPLAIIQTSSDLLSRYFDKLSLERREKSLQQIRDQIVHLTKMVNDVLTLGRAESGRIEFNPTQLELTSFCEAIFDQVRFADNEQHQFFFTNKFSEQSIMADGNLLKHILTNLLTNAVKYSPEKSKIALELDQDKSNIIIKVSDEGIGIPEEDQVRLFEPFHRAGNVSNIQGTGMGLSIVKEYVELHGGRIEFESEMGKGSTFRIMLPLA